MPGMVDLSDHYNRLVEEMWPSAQTPLLTLRDGIFESNGAAFDARGLLQLNGSRPDLVYYPAAISNIVINLHGRSAQLLVGALCESAPDTPLADCIFHLADGRQQRLRIVAGQHAISSAGAALSIGSLAQWEWSNPAPDQVIASMDFVARQPHAGVFLLGLTIQTER